jgi:hypothetical protein
MNEEEFNAELGRMTPEVRRRVEELVRDNDCLWTSKDAHRLVAAALCAFRQEKLGIRSRVLAAIQSGDAPGLLERLKGAILLIGENAASRGTTKKIRGGFICEKDAAGRWRGVGVFVPKQERHGCSIDHDVEVYPGKHALAQGLFSPPFAPQPVVGLCRFRRRSRETGAWQAMVLTVLYDRDGTNATNAATNVEEFLLCSGVDGVVETTPAELAKATSRYEANRRRFDREFKLRAAHEWRDRQHGPST